MKDDIYHSLALVHLVLLIIMLNTFRTSQSHLNRLLLALIGCLLLFACGNSRDSSLEKLYKENPMQLKKLQVTATAYNSLPDQTSDDPNVTAWGDNLKPGMKVIAVSRDLISRGLGYNTEVKIEGLSGTYKVLDKMNARWSNKIDIYMGLNIDQAKEWGSKKVTIYWK